MAVILDPVQVDWQASGTRWSATPHEARVPASIRVGTRSPGRRPGPLGVGGRWTRWSSDPRFRLSPHARKAYYQEVAVWVYPHARILQHGVYIHVLNASEDHLSILDNTLAQVPPAHLEAVAGDKPVGLGLTAFVGSLADPNFSGGLNAGVDLPYTPWDDRRGILITYGSLFNAVDTRVCLSVFHEFGHVMTRHGLSISGVDADLWNEIRTIEVSTNPGELEALCDAYMFMLAGGASIPAVRRNARNENNVLSSRRMRRALLDCGAFARLPEEWRARYE